MKNIAILGSTGSIGTQTLEIIKNNREELKVCSITGNTNIDILEKQVREFHPELVVIKDESKYKELKSRIGHLANVGTGLDGVIEAATMEGADYVVSAIVGIAGLVPTYMAVKYGKTIGLANKETLVTAGNIITKAAVASKSRIIPIDSEHSAIFQCIAGTNHREISKIILTASGGPFRGKNTEELKNVSIEETLKHPKWSMGKKISVDSATLMNKGLEVIEARWLFSVNIDNIEVCVHPESIIHSMVEFIDGAVIAQLGVPDMRIPIQYAITYPNRINNDFKKLDLFRVQSLTFERPQVDKFKCLKLAYEALELGDSACVVLNAANEIAVQLFLEKKINFTQIGDVVEDTLDAHSEIPVNTIEEVLYIDNWARNKCMQLCKERCEI